MQSAVFTPCTDGDEDEDEDEGATAVRRGRRRMTASVTPLLVFWPHGEWMLGRNFSDTTPIISETNKNMAVV